MITAIVTVLCIFGLLCMLPRRYLWFARNRVRLLLVLTLAAFALNYLGYAAKYADSPLTAAAMALYGTGKTLTLSNTSTDYLSYIPQFTWFPAVYSVLLCCTALIMTAFVLSLWGYRILCGLQLGFLRLFGVRRDIYLFSALNENALSVARSACNADDGTRRRKPLCVFLVDPKAPDAELENQAAARGFLLASRGAHTALTLCGMAKGRKEQALRLFTIQPSDEENVAFFFDTASNLEKARRVPQNVSAYLPLQDDVYARVLDAPRLALLDAHPISLHDLACRALFARFIPLSAARDGALHVALFGGGAIDATLLRYLTVLGQQTHTRLTITLLGANAAQEAAAFHLRCPQAERQVCIETVCHPLQSEACAAYLRTNGETLGCCFVTDGDAHTALFLHDSLTLAGIPRPIWVYTGASSALQRILESASLPGVRCFGERETLFSAQVLVDETLDRLAKAVHAFYCTEYALDTPWDALTLHAKDSNRSSALHIHTKLYTLGLQTKAGESTALLEQKLKDPDVVLGLSQMEHLRWNAYHYTNGWRTLPLEEANGKTKDEARRLHVCLVDYDALDAVSAAFGRDFKRADSTLVEHLPEILQSAGLGTALWEDDDAL